MMHYVHAARDAARVANSGLSVPRPMAGCIGVVLSGGNVDRELLADVLCGNGVQ